MDLLRRDHVEEAVPAHGGGDPLAQQPAPAHTVLLDDLPRNRPDTEDTGRARNGSLRRFHNHGEGLLLVESVH